MSWGLIEIVKYICHSSLRKTDTNTDTDIDTVLMAPRGYWSLHRGDALTGL